MTVDSNAVPAEQQTSSLDTRTVSADYFRVMGIPLVAGEFFSNSDEPAPVILINEAMARRYWPDGQALGKRIKLGLAASNSPWFLVKGVVADSAQGALDAQVKPEVYFALSQMAHRYRRMNLVVRTQGEPKAMLNSIQQKVWEIDKDQPVYQVQTLNEMVSDSIGTRRFALQLLLLFAGFAMALAFIGIYGVMSYGVSQRTHELGIRLALGAGRRNVLRLILTQGMTTVAKGLAIGLVGAFAATRLMANLLFGVSATDPLTFLAISLLLVFVALLACYVPARRAMKVDPIIALRYQ
jgi:putative ABC transport system permease protein